MRILVAVDQTGPLTSREAGEALALGWQDAVPGAEIAVAAMGEAGAFADAFTALLAPSERLVSADPALVRAALQDVAGQADARVWIDLGGPDREVHDAGRELLLGLGAHDGADRCDLTAVRELVGETSVVGIVPAAEREQHLVGLRGITSLRGRERGDEPAVMLAADAALEAFTQRVGRTPEPGDGACGGLAYAVGVLGGTLQTGPEACAARQGLAATARQADLIVTGATSFDFGTRGGGVIGHVADLARDSLTPCIVLAGHVQISGREMRTLGIESAYACDSEITAEALRTLAARVGRTWRW